MQSLNTTLMSLWHSKICGRRCCNDYIASYYPVLKTAAMRIICITSMIAFKHSGLIRVKSCPAATVPPTPCVCTGGKPSSTCAPCPRQTACVWPGSFSWALWIWSTQPSSCLYSSSSPQTTPCTTGAQFSTWCWEVSQLVSGCLYCGRTAPGCMDTALALQAAAALYAAFATVFSKAQSICV